jgi:hypothetical protein
MLVGEVGWLKGKAMLALQGAGIGNFLQNGSSLFCCL